MRSILLSFLTFVLVIQTHAQVRFGAEDTITYISKTTDFSTLHFQLTLKNKTADSLQMRWHYLSKFAPQQWSVGIQDPSQRHSPIFNGDSADFILADSTDNVSNKMIISVDHNGQTGYGLFIFTLYEIDNPNDSLRLYFDVSVSQGMALNEKAINDYFYPNPAQSIIYYSDDNFNDRLLLFTAEGSSIYLDFVNGKSDVSHLQPGLYFLQTLSGNTPYIQKILIE